MHAVCVRCVCAAYAVKGEITECDIGVPTYVTICKKCECEGLAHSTDHRDHLKLFRTYVSRKAAGKARAVLEGIGLDAPTMNTCFTGHPQNNEEAVQAGLTKWVGGQGHQPPTWSVLFEAMEYAMIEQQAVQGLKEKLGLN